MVVLDDWHYHNSDQWYECVTGHLFSLSLGDGSVLTTNGHYPVGAALNKWQP